MEQNQKKYNRYFFKRVNIFKIQNLILFIDWIKIHLEFLLLRKNRETAKLLTSLFRLRKIHKTYLAVCNGEISQSKGEWKGELIRYDGNKKITEKAITKFKVIDKNNNSTLIQMNPVTGRKHQLRKQLSELDHPIYGDSKYTFNKSLKD